MAGTISFPDDQGQRIHTIYTGVAPESGKQSFDYVFDKEIDKVRSRFANCTWVGVADGAFDNWTFLESRTDVQTLDFFHAAGYLGNYAKKCYGGKHQRSNWPDNACHRLKHNGGAAKEILAEMKQQCQE